MSEHQFAMIGIGLSVLIVLGLLIFAGLALSEKIKDWTRWHERKWRMESRLDEFDGNLAQLEARVSALEAMKAIDYGRDDPYKVCEDFEPKEKR